MLVLERLLAVLMLGEKSILCKSFTSYAYTFRNKDS
mgnify:CR=1 FL=1